MKKEFTGWVPTAGGRLSFSVIGQTSHPQPTSFFNEAGKSRRFIFGYQHRNQSDASRFLWIGPLLNIIKGISGNFTFAMYASSDDIATDIDDPLVGRVFIFYQNRDVSSELSRMSLKIQDTFGVERNERDLDVLYEDTLIPNLIALYNDHGIYMLDVCLSRNGKAVFRHPCDGFSVKAFEKRKEIIGFDELERHVASELFFFLKDVCHKHQHHSPRTDTIVDLYETSSEKNLWVNETLRSLYKRVLDFKRSSAPGTSYSALGILAYVRCFKKEFCADKNQDQKYLSLNDDELEASINICKMMKESETAKANEVNSFRLSVFVALFTVWAALFGLFALAPNGADSLVSIKQLSSMEVIIVNALLANPLILLLPFWFFAVFHVAIKPVPKPTEFKRILFVIPKPIQILILLSLMLILSGIGIWNMLRWIN